MSEGKQLLSFEEVARPRRAKTGGITGENNGLTALLLHGMFLVLRRADILRMRPAGDDENQYDGPDYDPDDEDPGEECGRWVNGRLSSSCRKVGSEECDWECPYRSSLRFAAAGKERGGPCGGHGHHADAARVLE